MAAAPQTAAAPVTGPSWRDGVPVALLGWATCGIAVNVGMARLTYGMVLPQMRHELGLDYALSGALNGAHLAGYLAGTLVAPALARRLGMTRLARGAHLMLACGAALCMLAPTEGATGLAALAAGRIAAGLGAAAAVLAIIVILFGGVRAEARAAAGAIAWSGMGAAVVLTALMLPWTEAAGGWRLAFGTTALMAAMLAFIMPQDAADPPAPAQAAGTWTEALAPRRTALLGAYLCFGVGYIAYATFAGARLASAAAPMALVATSWAVFGAASMAGGLLTVAVLARPELRRWALAGAAAAGAAGAWSAAGDGPWAALSGSALVGLGLAAIPAIVSARTRDRFTAETYPHAMSLATAALGLGQLAGPVLAGLVADQSGTAAVPMLSAAAYGAVALLAVLDERLMRGQSPAA